MTALGQLNAGSRLTADEVRGVAPLEVIKGADETVSTLTLQNDNALLLSVDANASYDFYAFVDYEGGTLGSSDLKLQFTIPSGASLKYQAVAQGTGGTPVSYGIRTQATANAFGTGGSGVTFGALMSGTLVMGGTAGTLQMQWCQNSGTLTNTTVHAGSSLRLLQVS